MNEKAEFAVKTLREYDKQTGVGLRNTSDLSPLEEWLIIQLMIAKEDNNHNERTFKNLSQDDLPPNVRLKDRDNK